MVVSIELKNYRSYKQKVTYTLEASSSRAKDFNYVEVNEFRILKTSFMYGPNASGKSNIVRAFYELRNLIIKKPTLDDSLIIYDPFKFDVDSSSCPVEMEIEILLSGIKYRYVTKIELKNILEEALYYYPNKREVTLFERNPFDEKTNIQKGHLGDKFGKKEITVFKNQLLLSKFGDDEPHEIISEVFLYFKRMYVYNATNKLHYELLNKNVSKELLENNTLKSKLEKLINYADTKIKGIEINESDLNKKRRIDYLWDRTGYNISGIHDLFKNNEIVGETTLSLLEESIGTQSLVVLGAKIIEALENGSVLIVDELDSSLHSFITKMIVMLFQDENINNKNAQLIFTTHDITLLDKDLIRKDQIWITEKNNKGETDLYSLQDFENLREDTSFDKWYLAGKFGGIPQIKSLIDMF